MAEKDLISREAAVKLARTLVEYDEGGWGMNVRVVAVEDIASLPAVDAVPVVHGRWYKPTGMMPPEHHGRHRCSVCGHMALYERPGREELSDYCPNCGAKMDGEVGSDRGEKHCIVDGTTITITNEPFVIEGGFVVDVGKKADNALE